MKSSLGVKPPLDLMGALDKIRKAKAESQQAESDKFSHIF
jgi:hypothetical protein